MLDTGIHSETKRARPAPNMGIRNWIYEDKQHAVLCLDRAIPVYCSTRIIDFSARSQRLLFSFSTVACDLEFPDAVISAAGRVQANEVAP